MSSPSSIPRETLSAAYQDAQAAAGASDRARAGEAPKAPAPEVHRKKISILVPCYNEEDNVIPISEAIIDVLERELSEYDYELLFIDNCSTDLTRPRLRQLCAGNRKIRAIFNAKNFGQFNSPYYGLMQTTGDCAICICADFQDPPELIPRFVEEWEKGAQIVCGIKTSSQESKFMYWLRTRYYRFIQKASDVEQIEHFTGFGLYDRSFLEVMRGLDDPTPFLRGIVAELGGKRVDIEYEQAERKHGKTHNNWYTLYDAAMLSFTSYTKVPLRVATIGGFVMSVFFILLAIVLFIVKLVNWHAFAGGQVSILIVTLLMGSIILFFLGLLGEYIMSIAQRVMHRPLVVEEERINFS